MSRLGPPLVGDLAPDFPLNDPAATTLADFRGRADVVLFFYPKDNTPGCTAQACSFRDDYAAFRQRGAEVIGISGDSGESHAAFAGRHHLPYSLVTDGDGSIRRDYGIRKTWGLIPGRVSILVDRDGVIRQIHESQFRPASHVLDHPGNEVDEFAVEGRAVEGLVADPDRPGPGDQAAEPGDAQAAFPP